MQRALLLLSTALLLGLSPLPAAAAEPAPEAQPAPASEASNAPAEAAARTPPPWIHRFAPKRSMTELGVYGGVLLTSRRAELFEAELGLPDQGYRPLAPVAPDLGLRVGYFGLRRPLRWFGVEAEGGLMPTRAEPRGRALLWTMRGSVVAQLGLWSVTPFVLAGGGLLGVASKREVVGNDIDAAFHVGGGVKVYLGPYTALRLDVRNVVTARRGYKEGLSNSPEILLGMTVTLGRRPAPRSARPAPEP